MITPLADKPTLRRRIYIAFWMIGITLGAIRVGYETVDSAVPDLLKAALGAYAFVGGAIGIMAAGNVGNPAQPDDVVVDGDDESLPDH